MKWHLVKATWKQTGAQNRFDKNKCGEKKVDARLY